MTREDIAKEASAAGAHAFEHGQAELAADMTLYSAAQCTFRNPYQPGTLPYWAWDHGWLTAQRLRELLKRKDTKT